MYPKPVLILRYFLLLLTVLSGDFRDLIKSCGVLKVLTKQFFTLCCLQVYINQMLLWGGTAHWPTPIPSRGHSIILKKGASSQADTLKGRFIQEEVLRDCEVSQAYNKVFFYKNKGHKSNMSYKTILFLQTYLGYMYMINRNPEYSQET